MSNVHPLDFEALKKGDVISQQQIESIYQVQLVLDADRFRFKAMELMGEIESARDDLLCRIDGGTVRVMTDAEAEEVTWRRIEQSVGTIGRNAKRRAAIVRDEFDDQQRKVAESRDLHATFLMVATRKQLQKARREELLLGPKSSDGEAAE